MDELLFISMAKLGADRLQKEREERADAQAATHTEGLQKSSCADPSARTGVKLPVMHRNALLAGGSLALALTLIVVLGTAAMNGWYDSATAPAGQVYITELSDASGRLTVAQTEVVASNTH